MNVNDDLNIQREPLSESQHEILERLAPQPNEYILDLGCGTGELTYKIAEEGAEVLGIDIDINSSQIQQANDISQQYDNSELLKVTFQEMDATQ